MRTTQLHLRLFDEGVMADYTKQIEYILNNFDFDKVLKTMTFLDWKWHSVDLPSVPSIIQMKETARCLLSDLSNHDDKDTWMIGTGGFTAIKAYGHLNLFFNVAEMSWDQDLNDENEEVEGLTHPELPPEPIIKRTPVKSAFTHIDI
mgnify:CR=1 FL=1